MKIGFIGTGVMGSAIASHLISAGNQLAVYNRTKSKTDSLVKQGAIWYDSPAEVAAVSELVFTMVGFPSDVEAVYFGEKGIFKQLKPDSIVVDMTTSKPSLAVKISKYAAEHHFHALDAPVSGGDIGAKNASLTIMVGGEEKIYQQLVPIFKIIGKTTTYFGSAGAGQHAKMANQIMIAGTMTGLTEMLLYTQKAGLDEQKVLAALSGGGADNWSMENYVPRILRNDYTPGFFARHFLKDLRIALAEADKMGLDLRATENAKRLYEIMVDVKGLGNQGTQGLINIYDK
ncbi:hypothetical protein FC89_GL001520 [Liquorilactobacillus ghanensis DSM 18630]|uniref:3-hydroxyisobutyrate dehydrogenase n=1 Tax=Liquorilactobacillus ghanensis DSM 18630 TaxID=1423750 RepID=A0A0R1VKG5_9LACO|nr:hypothetical protein FC89_GL001520 [Liquorilactobacillus ghanensis DSM 18630]